MLQELEALGFTPDTVSLLPLVPIVQVAWAEAGVSDDERKLIVQFARGGISRGEPGRTSSCPPGSKSGPRKPCSPGRPG